MSQPLVVFVDVDDTLVRHVGVKQIPIPGVVGQVRDLHSAGAVLFCWSTGGADYARSIAELVGLDECFDGFLPKPNVMIDDQAVSDWRRCIEVTPSETAGQTPDAYAQRVGQGP